MTVNQQLLILNYPIYEHSAPGSTLRFFLRSIEGAYPLDIWKYKNMAPKSAEELLNVKPFAVFNNNIIKRQTSQVLHAFKSVSATGAVQKVTTNKGDIYYGCENMILDCDFNPLFIVCADTTDINDERWNLLYYVSPKVYHNEGLMHKAILKTFIPALASANTVYFNMYNRSVNIIISNKIDEFIVKPSTPKLGESEDAIKELLLENIDKTFG